MRRVWCPVLILVACLWPSTIHASPFDSLYRFQTLRTPHFSIYFHQGTESLATHLAALAEETWRAMQRPFGPSLPSLTHVVLVDQTERSNGSATPLPRNTIVIYTAWPRGSDFLRADDWLRVVFTHEFTHIVHLDRSRGYATLLKYALGRTPFAFPNLFLPTWQVEGLATYEESALTGTGRLHAGNFRVVVDEAARRQRLEPLDRVNGGLATWTNGHAPYAYGLGFHAFLANRYGAASFATLADRTAGRLPFFGTRAFKAVYGRSLGELWREYDSSVLAAAQQSAASQPPAERLTHHGSTVIGPRFDRPPCPACPADILYSTAGPDAFPSLYRLTPGGTPRLLTWRYQGSTTAPATDALYFDESELAREAGLYSDLYRLDRASSRVTRLTDGARLVDPDLSPDGGTIVAAREHTGQRDLVVLPVTSPGSAGAATLGPPKVVLSETGTQFNAPRWSPDGRALVVERHRLGQQPDIVIVDIATGSLRVVAANPRVRWVTPVWRPDGGAIVAAADFNEGPFDLYEINLSTLEARRLTETTGGATWPDISADGSTIIYVGYTADGFDVFRTPYRVAGASIPAIVTNGGDVPSVPFTPPSPPASAGKYSPWPTLVPVAWYPVISTSTHETRLGAGTFGTDVLAYHSYSLSASWPIERAEGVGGVSDESLDWNASYAYTRWRPVVYASASTETSFLNGPPTEDGHPDSAARRERLFETGVAVPITHVRTGSLFRASFLRARNEFTFVDRTAASDRSALRGAASVSTANFYGHSISFEDGALAGTTVEFVRPAFGASGRATTLTGDVRLYLPGFLPHHVLAVRAGAGASRGDRTVVRAFLLGGGSESNADPATFSSDSFSLLRGFPDGAFAGTSVSVLNVDYRWPLLRIERGWGTFPVFLDTIHAAVFADAGYAWTRRFELGSIKRSVGAELSANIVFGYALPITLTGGVGFGYDGSGLRHDDVTYHFRVGRAF